MIFPESKLAHSLLDGLTGVEIGGAAHQPWGLNTRNVDLYPGMDTVFKKAEIEMCGRALPVDIVAPGDRLPFPSASLDFVVSSHVLEHFFDPIKAIEEWLRVIRPGGYVLMLIPDKDRIFDKDKPVSQLMDIVACHSAPSPRPGDDGHWHCWNAKLFKSLAAFCHWPLILIQDPDDKVGNGFTAVLQKAIP